ncbi:MAG: aldehyde dehydrogenase family protein, partial [Thermoanaerobaculum sp.]|nr:aldehyde dehydrogenase family protein [Thermoanaerobaculum sp.]
MVEPRQILESLGLSEVNPGAYAAGWLSGKGEELVSVNPTTGRPIARVQQADSATYEQVSQVAYEAFLKLRMMPAPKRGEIIRALGDELRAHKEALGRLVSLEMGKILSEGLGEVQEMIDMCDFAVGLSRQLYGLTM